MNRVPLVLALVLGLWTLPWTARGQESTEDAPEEQAPSGEGDGEEPPSELAEARRQIEELRTRLERLEAESRSRSEQEEGDDLEALRREAEALATAPETAEERREEALPSDQVFTSGQRALQALNPEISVVVDTGVSLTMVDGDPDSVIGLEEEHESGHSHGATTGSGFFFRHLGIHFETNLDPFSFTKIAFGVGPDGAHLGEAYVTWVRVAAGLQLTLGKFRQHFGVVNRWHVPSCLLYTSDAADDLA